MMSLESMKTALQQRITSISYTQIDSANAPLLVSSTRAYCGLVDDRAADWGEDATTKIPGDPAAVKASAATFAQAATTLEGLAAKFTAEASTIKSSMDAKAGAASALELEALSSLATLEAGGLTVMDEGLRKYASDLKDAQSDHSTAATKLSEAKSSAATIARPGDDVSNDDPAWPSSRLQGIVAAADAVLDDAKVALEDMVTAVEDAISAARQLGYVYSDAAGYQRMDHVTGTGSAGYVQTMLALVHDVDDPYAATVSDAEWKQYQAELNKLSPKDREKVATLLADARTPAERQLLISGFATGAGLSTTEKFAQRLAKMSTDEVKSLADFGIEEESGTNKRGEKSSGVVTKDGKIVQQMTGTTCGPSSLLMLAAQRDPFLALYLQSGELVNDHKPAFIENLDIWGESFFGGEDTRTMPTGERLEHIQTELRKRTNEWTLWPGHWVGSAPWGMEEEIERIVGGDATMDYDLVGGHSDPESIVNQTVAAVDAGQPVPLLVGNGAIPMHYVLAVSHEAGVLTVYEPGSGAMYTINTEDMIAGGSAEDAYGGWTHLYGAGVPAQ